MEDPCSPPDPEGFSHVLSYMCIVCGGVLFAPLRALGHSEFRSAFAGLVFRSGTVPVRLGCDNGPEMRNAALAELKALLGMSTRFGSPWRPVEQAPVERSHQEAMRERGILLNGVFHAFCHAWSTMLPIC